MDKRNKKSNFRDEYLIPIIVSTITAVVLNLLLMKFGV